MGEFAIGQGVPRFEDPRLIRGGGRYTDDVKLPGMVYGVMLRSPHAHARIRSIDATAAQAAPGVITVITAADIEAQKLGDLPVPGGLKMRDGSPALKRRAPILADDKVRGIGDGVAFIVAETITQALDAAELVNVDYEPLPAVTGTEDALKPDAPKVWDDLKDNVGFVELIGDKATTDEAFARAHRIVRQKFVINRVTAVSMEPRGAVGDYNATDNRYTIYTAIQRPHPARTDFAKIMGVPESKMRIVTGDTGGSFGMKSLINPEMPLVLLASKITGRPVKWISTRTEAFASDPQGRDNVTEAELALDKNGIFLGLRVKLTAAIGAYLQTGMPGFYANCGSLAGCYRTPAIHVDVTAVYSHTNPVRPYRGNGRPEAAYVIERMVDIAADEMGIDPVELRRRNYIAPDAMPYKTGLTFTYDSGEFEANMDLALKLADADGYKARRQESLKNNKLRGFGLSNTIERAAADLVEGAEIRFDRSGAVMLITGADSQGQGHETVFKQLVCDRLGLDPAEVQYMQGDTDLIVYGVGTGGSRTSALAGSAFLKATDKVIAKARTIAAHVMKVEDADLKFEDGVFSSSKTNLTLSIAEIARIAAEPAKLPKDMEAGLSQTAIHKGEKANYPNGCHVCEVEIDRDTGRAQIVRYAVVDDVGTVLNPMLLHGQIHGGIAQGAGQILMENIVFDSEGQIVTGSFMDYAMPHAHDFPPIKVEAHSVPTPTNPLGVKGAGEAGTVGAMPAITNALVDALSEFGVKHVDMPATPERLWRLMQPR